MGLMFEASDLTGYSEQKVIGVLQRLAKFQEDSEQSKLIDDREFQRQDFYKS